MKINYRFVCLLICTNILLSFLVFGQKSPISIDSNVDKSIITIGEIIKYTIVVTRSPDVQMEMPGLATNLDTFEIRNYEVFEPESKDGEIIDRIEYDISAFYVGEFTIPPLTFQYTLPNDSTKHALKTKKINIVVKSMQPSQAGDIRDVKNPQEKPRDFRKYILWGAIGFAVLLIFVSFIYVWRRKRAGKGLLPMKLEPPRPAHEIALEALNELKESSLIEEGNFKEYYIQVSEIIRRYIENRYFIGALEMTTFELLGHLSKSEVEHEILQLAQDFLEFCDLVKFAKYKPTKNEADVSLNQAFDIVEKTKLIYDQVEEKAKAENEKESEPALSLEEEKLLVENTIEEEK